MKTELEALRLIEDREERYNSALKLFQAMRQDAARRVDAEIEKKGIAYVSVEEIIGYTRGGLHRTIQRDFNLKPLALSRLAYQLLSRSCHEVLFGFSAVTELPKLESDLVRQFLSGSEKRKNEAFTCIMKLYQEDKRDGTLYSPTDGELVCERVQTLCEDRNVQPMYLLGNEECHSVKINLRKITFQQTPPYTPRNAMLMYLAWSLNTSLDYFTAPDYTEFTDLRCFGARETELVKDPLIKSILGKFLLLSEASRARFVSHLLNASWNSCVPA